MKIFNFSNIEHAERIIELCAEGINTTDLTVYITFPETEEEKGMNGVFIPDQPPIIKIFLTDRVLNNQYSYGMTNAHQFIAKVMLHELYHYAAWKKDIPYIKARQEPLADTYAFHTLKSIGININTPSRLNQELRASTGHDFNTILQETQDAEMRDGNGFITNIIPLPGYVDRASIGASYREHMRNTPGGVETIKIKFFRRFHCGHYCWGKNLGMDCSNTIPTNKQIPNWHHDYHIVCAKCVIARGCSGCGRPGCRLCLTLTDKKWLCLDCLNEQTRRTWPWL